MPCATHTRTRKGDLPHPTPNNAAVPAPAVCLPVSSAAAVYQGSMRGSSEATTKMAVMITRTGKVQTWLAYLRVFISWSAHTAPTQQGAVRG